MAKCRDWAQIRSAMSQQSGGSLMQLARLQITQELNERGIIDRAKLKETMCTGGRPTEDWSDEAKSKVAPPREVDTN